MNMPIRRNDHDSGFSLIEILIAVVILATGLLALTALQGRLAQASAEAKTRSRVAAMLSSRMDELRASQYDGIPTGPGTGSVSTSLTCTSGSPAWLCSAQTESGVGSLSVTQAVVRYGSAIGASAFTFPNTSTPANLATPEFKRITLSANWTDASAATHRLAMSSDVSPMTLRDDSFPTDSSGGTGGGKAVVRQDSPATAGVIPIALGDGNSTAASNPKPELKGTGSGAITATTFNILTYVPGGNSAVIQKRFENEVIKCKCQYGAAGSGFSNLGTIYRAAQWPAVWTGGRYDVYVPSAATNAPGTSFISGQASGVTQSDLCTECCRDHHDTATSGVAKFDPERIAANDGVGKFDASLVAVANTTSATYIDACRVIRVDGFWRVASDMYSRQMGLLETETVSSVQAKTGLPTTAAKSAYETFVKDYLDGYTGGSGTAPLGAQTMFDDSARGLNTPATVTITTPSNIDYRYLHDRGLYVDYLEADARTVVADAINNCASGVALADCVLPVLPFTTINLTEIAKWTASLPAIITVNSGSLLTNNPTQPSGSRTYGKANGDSNNTAEVRTSNSGVAVQTQTGFTTINGVDPSDNTTVQTDAQSFHVGAGGGGPNPTGESFNVVQSGGGGDPSAFFTIGTDVNVECVAVTGVTGKVCDPNASASPWAGSLKLSRYWALTTDTTQTKTPIYYSSGNTKYYTVDGVTCTGDTQSGGNKALKVSVPIFINYRVNTVTVTGTGSITTLIPAASVGDNVQAETTTIAFTGLTTASTINVGYSEESRSSVNTAGVTVAGCAMTKSGNDWTLSISSWNVPWD